MSPVCTISPPRQIAMFSCLAGSGRITGSHKLPSSRDVWPEMSPWLGCKISSQWGLWPIHLVTESSERRRLDTPLWVSIARQEYGKSSRHQTHTRTPRRKSNEIKGKDNVCDRPFSPQGRKHPTHTEFMLIILGCKEEIRLFAMLLVCFFPFSMHASGQIWSRDACRRIILHWLNVIFHTPTAICLGAGQTCALLCQWAAIK